MPPLHVAINGFGRTGRLVARALLEAAARGAPLRLVAVNDIAPAPTLAHLFAHDTLHGRWPGLAEATDGALRLEGHGVAARPAALREPDPARLPWAELGVDVVVEATGRHRTREAMGKHLDAGARRVLLTAPAKRGGADATLVLGVNGETYDPARHRLVSNSSCTTNALAPVLKVLHEAFGVERALVTTVHAYTNDQRLLDAAHGDLRRARAAALCIVPTSTGASESIAEVMPALAGKVDGLAVRVPVADVSLLDLTVELAMGVAKEDLDAAFRSAAAGALRGILAVEELPLVSADFVHNPASAVVDLPGCMLVDHRLVKVLAWYDNEWAYAVRVAEVLAMMAAREGPARPAGSAAEASPAGARAG